jgi:hypothetical protein
MFYLSTASTFWRTLWKSDLALCLPGIADFGLCHFNGFRKCNGLVGNAIMETPRWLAPKLIPHIQDAQVKRHHTYASDIYAFALVCYEASYFSFHCRNLHNGVTRLDVFRQTSIRGF